MKFLQIGVRERHKLKGYPTPSQSETFESKKQVQCTNIVFFRLTSPTSTPPRFFPPESASNDHLLHAKVNLAFVPKKESTSIQGPLPSTSFASRPRCNKEGKLKVQSKRQHLGCSLPPHKHLLLLLAAENTQEQAKLRITEAKCLPDHRQPDQQRSRVGQVACFTPVMWSPY